MAVFRPLCGVTNVKGPAISAWMVGTGYTVGRRYWIFQPNNAGTIDNYFAGPAGPSGPITAPVANGSGEIAYRFDQASGSVDFVVHDQEPSTPGGTTPDDTSTTVPDFRFPNTVVLFNFASGNTDQQTVYAPTVPVVSGVPLSDTSVQVAWPACGPSTPEVLADVSRYDLQRADAEAGPFVNVAPDIVATGFIDTGLTPGATYWYRARARLTYAHGLISNPQTGTPYLSAFSGAVPIAVVAPHVETWGMIAA